MNRKFTISALIMATGLAAAGGLAYAKSSDAENDAIADLEKATITLTQAVGTAEAHAQGRATKAELDGDRGTVVYEIEVVTSDNKVLDVTVDAANGKVLSSKQDQVDRSDEADEKD